MWIYLTKKKSQKRTIFDSCAHTKSASENQTKQEIQKLVNMIETNIQKEAQNSAGIRNQVGLWRLQNLSQLGVLLVKVSILMSPIINSKLFSKKRLFYLSNSVKAQFFKTLILPYFDFTLSIYFNKSVIQRLCNKYY